MYGMKLSELTDEFLSEIIALYDCVVGGSGRRTTHSRKPGEKLEYVQKWLDRCNLAEWRFGSVLSGDSKLLVCRESWHGSDDQLISFKFFANTDYNKRKQKQLAKKFEKAVDELFIQNDLAVELETRK